MAICGWHQQWMQVEDEAVSLTLSSLYGLGCFRGVDIYLDKHQVQRIHQHFALLSDQRKLFESIVTKNKIPNKDSKRMHAPG